MLMHWRLLSSSSSSYSYSPTAAFTLSHPPFLPVSVVIGGRVLRLLGDEESVAACLSVRALRDIRREHLLLAASTHRTMDQFDAVEEACLWGTAALWFYVIWPPDLVNITCLIGAITDGMSGSCPSKGKASLLHWLRTQIQSQSSFLPTEAASCPLMRTSFTQIFKRGATPSSNQSSRSHLSPSSQLCFQPHIIKAGPILLHIILLMSMGH